ncbi:MAG: hypothetical protein IJ300_09800 [Clostridia bacterium]|nr:hypothetical protein [Clostridia bacterium]
MADIIRIKGGSGTVPTLQDRELAYSKTEKALYIGTESGNERITGGDGSVDLSEINAQIADITARLEALENTSN